MKYMIWTLAAGFLMFAASCDLLDPTSNQATVEVNSQYSGCCPIAVNLDGNNGVTFNSPSSGESNTFPLVGAGSHTLNFSTSGSCSSNTCIFTNSGTTNGGTSLAVPFTAKSGGVYVGTVKLDSSGLGYKMVQSGP